MTNSTQTGTECYVFKTRQIIQNDASKKIALIYASDYGYGASKECTSNIENYYDDSNCRTTNNWLDKSIKMWLITPSSIDVINSFHVTQTGSVTSGFFVNSNDFSVLPVLTLSSNVKISGGSGTSDDPYTLSLE